MLNFEYKGISQGKYVEGEIEALNNTEAAHKLKEQKVIITKLIQSKKKKVVEKKKDKKGFTFGTGVKAKDILVFCKQFATMLRAGLPVLNTLEMLINQTASKGMKTIVESTPFCFNFLIIFIWSNGYSSTSIHPHLHLFSLLIGTIPNAGSFPFK